MPLFVTPIVGAGRGHVQQAGPTWRGFFPPAWFTSSGPMRGAASG